MNKEVTQSVFSDELLQVRMKKKEFLTQIDYIVSWGECCNKPYDLRMMLRIYLLRNHFGLFDKGTVAEDICSRAFSAVCTPPIRVQLATHWDVSVTCF